MLDDPSALVRRALAEALAGAFEAPRAIVLALAADQSDVAAVVLGRSPVLTEAELVDFAASGDAAAQCAIARRPRLPASIAAALAEVGRREAAIALADNLDADVRPSALWRLFERFGDDAEVRDALASRADLPPRCATNSPPRPRGRWRNSPRAATGCPPNAPSASPATRASRRRRPSPATPNLANSPNLRDACARPAR